LRVLLRPRGALIVGMHLRWWPLEAGKPELGGGPPSGRPTALSHRAAAGSNLFCLAAEIEPELLRAKLRVLLRPT
jgi:hypothetical protein